MQHYFTKYHPPNPNAVVYNFDFPLIDSPGILITSGAIGHAPAWCGQIVNTAGVAQVRVSRFKLLIKRVPETAWESITAAVENILRDALGLREMPSRGGAPDRLRWAVSPQFPDPLVVFSGPVDAHSNPVGRDLFHIPGIAEVVLNAAELTVVKGKLFRWDAILPDVNGVLVRHGYTPKGKPSSSGGG